MIDPGLLKTEEGLALLKKSLLKRGASNEPLDQLKELSTKRNALIASSEELQSRRKSLSKEIGRLMATDKEAAEKVKKEVETLSGEFSAQKEELSALEEAYRGAIISLPNLLDETTPEGVDENDNVEVRIWGEKPSFDFQVKPHYEVAEEKSLVDFARGVKLSGSRFYIYNEILSRIERRLIQFMIAHHEPKGYLERTVPLLVNDEAMTGTGQLPKFADEFYRLPEDGLNLIPTAEVPLTNIYADEILEEEMLPHYLMAATSCFRREAGSAGKDTRGLVRVHQFQKVELVKFVSPESSEQELEKLVNDAEAVLQSLGFHYRVLLLCAGDTGFSSTKTYDLEVWMPGLDRWLEVSSCSNFKDFQARRAKVRYKNKESGKNEPLHTLNGSGLAAGRLLAALMEYHQTPEGDIDWQTIENKLKI